MKKTGIAALALALCLNPLAARGEEIRLAASCVPAQLAAISAGAQNISLFVMPQAGYMEDYELSQSDFLRAQSADAVALIGGGLESFASLLYAEGLKPAIAAGENVKRLPGRVIDADEDETPAENPYIWLSPARWGELVHGMAAALAQIDPEHAAQYTQANDAAQAAAARVQKEMDAQLHAYADGEVVILHPALAYLCEDAGLAVAATLERDPSVVPHPADIEELDRLLAAYPDAIIAAEKDAPQAFYGLDGRKTAICDVLLRAPQTESAQTWENVMLENIRALAQALQ